MSASAGIISANQNAFLDAIAVSEIGAELLAVSDDGYNVEEGSTPENPILFSDYSTHPIIVRSKVQISDAAGRYQLMARYFAYYSSLLHTGNAALFPDGAFGKRAQDVIALQQIRECGAIDNIESGNLSAAMAKCGRIWASLPGSMYGQHTNAYANLSAAYVAAGGGLLA